MIETVSFLHGGNAGDVVMSLPSIADLVDRAGKQQAELYLEPGKPARYVAGPHPLGNVLMNLDYAEKLLPLLRSQPYIFSADIHNGQPIDINLNAFRSSGFPHDKGDIGRYYRHSFRCLPRTWEPWLTVEPDKTYSGMILVNRTQRYRNPALSYAFLRKYESRMLFLGLNDEYQEFQSTYQIRVPQLLPKDFYQAACAIAACKLFVGSQSCCWAIAEGLKVPRVVEIYPGAANCIPNGLNGWEAIRQDMFEGIVSNLAA